MTPQPELPHPPHIDFDSALGRKFGKEVTNYFGSEYGLGMYLEDAENV